MSERASAVECPICGTEFDPTAAGGWCTNPDCGEWQYEGAAVPDPEEREDESIIEEREDEPTTEANESTSGEGQEGDDPDVPDEQAEERDTSEKSGEAPEAEAGAREADTEADAADADTETGTADADSEPAAGDADDEADAADADTDAGVESERGAAGEAGADEIECPNCGTALSADANFCLNCGKDVADIEPGDEDTLSECPACGATVDPEDNFCTACGENLDAHRAEPLTECPDCGASVDEDDSFCAACGEDLDAHRAGAVDEGGGEDRSDETPAAPGSVVLSVRGRELTVEDGETVGRDLRRVVTETGGDEDDAVLIHREHVRFVREGDQFYLEDLGENPTAVNGESLSKGDRVPVVEGDEIDLSGVVTLTVETA